MNSVILGTAEGAKERVDGQIRSNSIIALAGTVAKIAPIKTIKSEKTTMTDEVELEGGGLAPATG